MLKCVQRLNIEKRRAIFQLVLANDANSFEAYLMLFDAMAESFGKALEVLDPCIKGFLAHSRTRLEFP